MRIDVHVRLVFVVEITQQLHRYDVLQYVSVVARVESVAIT